MPDRQQVYRRRTPFAGGRKRRSQPSRSTRMQPTDGATSPSPPANTATRPPARRRKPTTAGLASTTVATAQVVCGADGIASHECAAKTPDRCRTARPPARLSETVLCALRALVGVAAASIAEGRRCGDCAAASGLVMLQHPEAQSRPGSAVAGALEVNPSNASRACDRLGQAVDRDQHFIHRPPQRHAHPHRSGTPARRQSHQASARRNHAGIAQDACAPT